MSQLLRKIFKCVKVRKNMCFLGDTAYLKPFQIQDSVNHKRGVPDSVYQLLLLFF